MKEKTTNRLTRILDWCADGWEEIGAFFHRKPVLIVFMFIAACFITFLATYSAVTATQNKADIDDLAAQFCSGQPQSTPEATARNTQLCRDLLDQLLRNPTPQQKERLRELVLEAGKAP